MWIIKKKTSLSDFNVYFQFYFYILAVSSALLCVYILCNLYNLIWIICPQLGTMYRIICRYQEHTMELNVETNNSNSVGGSNPSKGNSTLHPNLIRFKSCQGTSDDEVTIPLAGNLFSVLSEYENLFPWDCRGTPIFGKIASI